MKVSIFGDNITITKAITEHINKKLKVLDKYEQFTHDGAEIIFTLKLSDNKQLENSYQAVLEIDTPSKHFYFHKYGEEAYTLIDKIINVSNETISQYKKKIVDKAHKKVDKKSTLEKLAEEIANSEIILSSVLTPKSKIDPKPSVVKKATKVVSAKPAKEPKVSKIVEDKINSKKLATTKKDKSTIAKSKNMDK